MGEGCIKNLSVNFTYLSMSSNQSKPQSKSSTAQLLYPHYIWDTMGVFLLCLAATLINLRMIRYGLSGHGDLLWHINWLQHFSKQIAEGIWYPRWLAGTNFGYGSPTFVFYPPLVYYIGSIFKLLGLNIEQTMSALFSLALFLSGLTFYIYGRTKWGKVAAMAGALSYMTCPGIAFLIKGGGLAFLFAFPWVPLGMYLTEKSLVNSKFRVPLALLWTIIALTHVPSLLICTIAWLFYAILSFLKHPWQSVIATIVSTGLGLGIASFYLLSAILEQRFVDIDFMRRQSLGGFQTYMLNLLDHLKVGLSDLFIQQLLAICILTIIALICYQKKPEMIRETGCWLAFALIVVFLMTNWSWPIWRASSTLQMIQSSERLGILLYFGEAALFAIAVSGVIQLTLPLKLISTLIAISIIFTNFRFGNQILKSWPALHNPGKGTVENIELLKLALYQPDTDKLIDVPQYRPLLKNIPVLKSDFLSPPKPSGVKENDVIQFDTWIIRSSPLLENGSISPPTPLVGQPKVSVINGKSTVEIEEWKSYQRILKVTVETPSIIRLRLYYYPAWHLYVNQNNYKMDVFDDGTIGIKLQPGSYSLELRYQWTPIFMLGVVLSFLSIIALILSRILLDKILH